MFSDEQHLCINKSLYFENQSVAVKSSLENENCEKKNVGQTKKWEKWENTWTKCQQIEKMRKQGNNIKQFVNKMKNIGKHEHTFKTLVRK